MKKCISCGEIVPQGHGYKSNRKYCSRSCFTKKSSRMLEIEKEFGKPLKDVILESLNKNQNIRATSELIGTTSAQLYRWMDKLSIKKVVYWTD